MPVIKKKIKVNDELLTKAFLDNKNLQMERVIQELKKMQFETADEIGWVVSLVLRLPKDFAVQCDSIHSIETPSTLMAKFNLPKLLDTSKAENRDLIIKNKSLEGILFLSMALFSLDAASRDLDEGNYDGYVSLTLLSVETFAAYEADNRGEKLKHLRAKINGYRRHSETYSLKKQAIEHWRAHIDQKLSNPKAADLLKKVVPVSHRKLVEYVAEAKRENIPPAS